MQRDALARVFARDGSLWSSDPEHQRLCADRLGWLDLPDTMRPHVPALRAFADGCAADGITAVVLCGMGGSSLAPEVLWKVFGAAPGRPRLVVLDTTDPRAIRAATGGLDLARTLIVIASKSGGTVETDSLRRHFDAALRAAGVADVGRHFVAITDPGLDLARTGDEGGWRAVFLNPEDVGGRYSALSLFGLVPAALLGIDAERLLDAGAREAATCRPGAPGFPSEALKLGSTLGALAALGVDKLTLRASPSLECFGDWVEQLVAESTGKAGPSGPVGILPVVAEAASACESGDRFFATMERLGDTAPVLPSDDAPQANYVLRDVHDLGAWFWRWEMATALAGALLGIDPFDQPDVAAAKAATNAVLAGTGGDVPAPASAVDLAAALDAAPADGYVAVLSYLPRGAAEDAAVRALAAAAGGRSGRPVTVGVGPRYLHSTGQLHKGGKPNGVFVVLEGPDPTGTAADVAVPGRAFSFGRLFAAQCEGDLATLTARGRTVVRLRADSDVAATVRAWAEAVRGG